MRFSSTYSRRSDFPSGVLGVTGTAPQTVAGVTIESACAGSALAARVYAKATTSSLTLTAKWQVLDDDGSTWRDAVDEPNTTPTVLVTGTGSAVTAVKFISAPQSIVAGNRDCRVAIVSAGATGGGAGVDECSIAYDYRQPSTAFGA